MQQLVEIIPILILLLLLLIEPHNAAQRDHPHRPLAQRDDEQDEETMNVPTNWVLQLLIVEPFNILFHIRENKKFESIKEVI